MLSKPPSVCVPNNCIYCGLSHVDLPDRQSWMHVQLGGTAGTGEQAANRAGNQAQGAYNSAADSANRAGYQAKDAANSAGYQARDAANTAGDKAQDAYSSAADTANRAGYQAKDAANSAGYQARDAAGRAGDAANQAGRDASRTANNAAAGIQQQAYQAMDAAKPYIDQAKQMASETAAVASDKARELASVAQAQGGDTLRWVLRFQAFEHHVLVFPIVLSKRNIIPCKNEQLDIWLLFHTVLQGSTRERLPTTADHRRKKVLAICSDVTLVLGQSALCAYDSCSAELCSHLLVCVCVQYWFPTVGTAAPLFEQDHQQYPVQS